MISTNVIFRFIFVFMNYIIILLSISVSLCDKGNKNLALSPIQFDSTYNRNIKFREVLIAYWLMMPVDSNCSGIIRQFSFFMLLMPVDSHYFVIVRLFSFFFLWRRINDNSVIFDVWITIFISILIHNCNYIRFSNQSFSINSWNYGSLSLWSAIMVVALEHSNNNTL